MEKATNSETCRLIRSYRSLGICVRLCKTATSSSLCGGKCQHCRPNAGARYFWKFTESADAFSLPRVLLTASVTRFHRNYFVVKSLSWCNPSLLQKKKKKGWMCEWGIEDDVKQAVYHHIHCAYVTCKFTFCTYTKHCKREIPDCFQSSLRRCYRSSSLSFPCLCVL